MFTAATSCFIYERNKGLLSKGKETNAMTNKGIMPSSIERDSAYQSVLIMKLKM
jgi:hypothetical protein